MDEPVLQMNLTGRSLDVIADVNLGSFRTILLQIKLLVFVNLASNYCPGQYFNL